MDPVSQAVVGANFSQSFATKKHFQMATIAGVLGGMFPDIDVLIQSKTDPLLALEYHRHFTHSLIMVPVLSLPVAWIIWRLFKKRTGFAFVYWFTFLGMLTHGLLDACTSYGTQLLWPFSNARIAWNNISIIDPLFTVPALVGVIWAHRTKNRRVAHGTFAFMILYLLFGVYQRDQAQAVAHELARSRGHEVRRVEAKPSMGNLVLWRTIYETTDHVFHVDAVHTMPGAGSKVYPGGSIARWIPEREPASYVTGTVLAHDIERFAWFSDNYLVQTTPGVIGDLRYATVPNSLEPLWGISIPSRSPASHVERVSFRVVNDEIWSKFKRMLFRQ